MKKTPEMFDAWNEQKKRIEFATKVQHNPDCGEFWRYREGVNIGSELSKDGLFKRPCLILGVQKNICLIVPLTTKGRGTKYQTTLQFQNHKKFHLKPSRFLINHIKIIDAKRLSHKHNNKKINTTLNKIIQDIYFSYIKRLSSEEKSIQTRSP